LRQLWIAQRGHFNLIARQVVGEPTDLIILCATSGRLSASASPIRRFLGRFCSISCSCTGRSERRFLHPYVGTIGPIVIGF
jgi:hypothetical protein